jgi:uncharacterized protein YuzE
VKLEYDPDVDAAYVRFRKALVASTEEVAPGVLLDLAEDGRAIGVELLDASVILGGRPLSIELELVSRRAPEKVGHTSVPDPDLGRARTLLARARRYEEISGTEESTTPPPTT